MAAVAKLLKLVSKSSSKFLTLGRLGVLPRNGSGTLLGLMLWMSLVAAAAQKESYPLVKLVLGGELIKPEIKKVNINLFCWNHLM